MSSFQKIGVVGAGMMGSEIALMFALAGYPTLLSDASPEAAERAVARLHDVLDRGLPRGFWTAEAATTARRQLSVVDSLDAYADVDFVIEAVFEDETLKRDVFKKLDAVLTPEAGLASNTSSISITTLSAAVAEPRRARFIGTHFFSPVSRMKLVEVIPAADTDAAFVDAVMGAMVAIGKAPIRVKDVVGFAVNRLLHALVLESIRLVEEGVCSPADIDVACKLGLGHPIGPFELMDNTQNSLSLNVHEILYQAYGERFLPRPLLRQMVATGYNGRKAGRGWHRYDSAGKKQ
ncbi:MAG: 3-hydroxyacyl-CoA dehydrogenase family protein [Bradyrhizobium sp.]|uniref:3-hydroxyacyl-CoA dehydrogenase family protein n=1 Tax=Bradyrhizobium sp. TaxID=376 RepID=UPI0029B55383|nr:3-hydroxyacyl-CoA dehydrogenase family protein [Bradyrhizobium sp.]MDX3968400.1 3-hydroxyacyl-CoA dehydrogenase family protein [Bradyrhizobium sp.]